MKTIRALLILVGLVVLAAPARAQSAQVPSWHADAATLTQHSHTTSATITLTAAGGGCGSCFVYIVGLDIQNCQGTAVTPAAPTFITTTGLGTVGSTSPQYMLASGAASAGSCVPVQVNLPPGGLRSAVAGTNVTFVLPAFVTNQVVSVNVLYYLGAK